jgi:hypothetical protein
MIQNKKTFSIGIFILILSSSFLGLPSFWKTFLMFVSGLILIGLSVKFTLPQKPLKRVRRKEKVVPSVDNISIPLVKDEIVSTPLENTSQSKSK